MLPSRSNCSYGLGRQASYCIVGILVLHRGQPEMAKEDIVTLRVPHTMGTRSCASSARSGSSAGSIEVALSLPLDVATGRATEVFAWVDARSDGFPIHKCSFGFTLLCGPSQPGVKFLDIVGSALEFNEWFQDQLNECFVPEGETANIAGFGTARQVRLHHSSASVNKKLEIRGECHLDVKSTIEGPADGSPLDKGAGMWLVLLVFRNVTQQSKHSTKQAQRNRDKHRDNRAGTHGTHAAGIQNLQSLCLNTDVCDNASVSSGSLGGSVQPVGSSEICVWFDGLQPGLPVLRFTAAFTLITGPDAHGECLVDWLADPVPFKRIVEQKVNETLCKATGAVDFGQVKLRPPSARRAGIEYIATCHLTFQLINEDSLSDEDDMVEVRAELIDLYQRRRLYHRHPKPRVLGSSLALQNQGRTVTL